MPFDIFDFLNIIHGETRLLEKRNLFKDKFDVTEFIRISAVKLSSVIGVNAEILPSKTHLPEREPLPGPSTSRPIIAYHKSISA